MEDLARDLRYAARALGRTPVFTTVAVLTIALGIGANTALFTVVNAVLLRPLPYRDPAQLVTILHGGTDPVAPANYVDWRDQSHSFRAMAAAEYWSPNLTGSDPPEHLYGLRLTANLLPMLGIAPLAGRVFPDAAEHEVVLGYGLWQRRFDGDRNVIGRQIRLDNVAYTVVGIMPREFQFAPFWATRAELWAPLALGDRIHSRGGNSLRIFARLAPGATVATARSEMALIASRLERRFPGTNRDVRVTPLKENVVGRIQAPLTMALGAVGFVLLIACANVAHMLLARTSEREKEIAIRTALGASRARIASQVLTESLLLGGVGGGAGLLLALAGVRALVALSPPYLPRLHTVAMDGGTVLFLAGITLVTALLFGVAPALRAAAGSLAGAMKEGGRGSSGGGVRRHRLRNLLVASEFALAFLLLIGAGLTIRSFAALESIDPGFNPHHVLSMIVSVAGSAEAAPPRRELFYRELLDRIRALPGVESAGAINHIPLAGDEWGWSFTIEGRPKPRPGEFPGAVYRIVMPGYFEAMRLPVLRGRPIGGQDDARAPGVVLINQRAATAYWPGQDPIGQRIRFGDDAPWLTVIGVVKNARQIDWAAEPEPEVYLAALQNRDFLERGDSHYQYLTLAIRTRGNPADLAPEVKRTVWSFDRSLPISQVLTMDQAVAEANAQPRFEMLLLGLFGAIALVLAAVGIYGVMNYAVSRRTHEIGIRVSLGATRASVLRMIVRQGMAPALAGSAVGVAATPLLAGALGKILYGVRPGDPATFAAAAALLLLTALAAVAVAGRKATRIEPLAALRQE
jgi:putative ABC transport system permease protein